MGNKNKNILSGIGVIFLVLIVLGISYAMYSFSGTGVKESVIVAGQLKVDYTETSLISINNMYPMSDSDGIANEEGSVALDFSVQSTIRGDATINYAIAIDQITEGVTLKEKYVKIYLEKNGAPATGFTRISGKTIKSYAGYSIVNVINDHAILTDSVTESTVDNYTLKAWIAEDYELPNQVVHSGKCSGGTSTGNELTENSCTAVNGTWNANEKWVSTTSEEFTFRIKIYATTDTIIQGIKTNTLVNLSSNGISNGGGDLPSPMSLVLGEPEAREAGAFWTEEYIHNITTITIDNTIDMPDNPVQCFDVSEDQDEGVMACLYNSLIEPYEEIGDVVLSNYSLNNIKPSMLISTNETLLPDPFVTDIVPDPLTVTGYYDLYIQGDGNIYTPEDSSYLFANFDNVTSITGLNLINTSNTTNMNNMFKHFGNSNSYYTLDVGNFDTSNVIDMSYMFFGVGNSYIDVEEGITITKVPYLLLEVDDFDTSNVTNMSNMFAYDWEYYSDCGNFYLDSLNLSGWDTSNVTDMSSMFSGTGSSNETFTLNLGSNFNTSNVTNMSGMFFKTGYSNEAFILDLGNNFNTSNVTDMSWMFFKTGYHSLVFTLDLGDSFNTSNVTDMSDMFHGTGWRSAVFTLNVDNWNTTSLENVAYMFCETGYSNPNFSVNTSAWITTNITNMSLINSCLYQR